LRDTIPDKKCATCLAWYLDECAGGLVGAIQKARRTVHWGCVHTFQKEGRSLNTSAAKSKSGTLRNLLIARTCGADSDLIAATPDQRPALARGRGTVLAKKTLTRFFQILLADR